MRMYRTMPGFWAVSVGRSPGGWHVQLGRWVFTTEALDG